MRDEVRHSSETFLASTGPLLGLACLINNPPRPAVRSPPQTVPISLPQLDDPPIPLAHRNTLQPLEISIHRALAHIRHHRRNGVRLPWQMRQEAAPDINNAKHDEHHS